MTSHAKSLFESHLSECREAIALYEHIGRNSVYRPDFSLRFVWIATISALDHYISQLILERSTEIYANNEQHLPKLLTNEISFASALSLREANPVDSVLVFKSIIGRCIKYKSFQNADKIADGLSYIWSEKHKWQYIAVRMNSDPDTIKEKLGNIVDRRNLIAHNADYDEARGSKMPINSNDTREMLVFVEKIVEVVDLAIYP